MYKFYHKVPWDFLNYCGVNLPYYVVLHENRGKSHDFLLWMSKTEKGCTQKNKRQSAKRRTNSYETFSFAYQHSLLHSISGHACIRKTPHRETPHTAATVSLLGWFREISKGIRPSRRDWRTKILNAVVQLILYCGFCWSVHWPSQVWQAEHHYCSHNG